MSKQICYNCVHNTYGEIRTIEGVDICYFDCRFKQELVKEDFEKDCEKYIEVKIWKQKN